MHDDNTDLLIGIDRIAAYLGERPRHTRNCCERGYYPAWQLGHLWHMRKSAYRALIEKLEREAVEAAEAALRPRRGRRPGGRGQQTRHAWVADWRTDTLQDDFEDVLGQLACFELLPTAPAQQSAGAEADAAKIPMPWQTSTPPSHPRQRPGSGSRVSDDRLEPPRGFQTIVLPQASITPITNPLEMNRASGPLGDRQPY